MRHLKIEPEKEGKGRTFRSTLLAYVTASNLWEGGHGPKNSVRPVFLAYACSEGESRPFTANIRMGKKAILSSNHSYYRRGEAYIELLKSTDYSFTTQRHAVGSPNNPQIAVITTVYLPSLFRMDPGMVDPKGVSFIVLPALSWIKSQKLDIDAALAHIEKIGRIDDPTKRDRYTEAEWPSIENAAHLATIAPLFAVHLDRRTRAPLLQDPKFHLQLLLAFLKQGLAVINGDPKGYYRHEFGRRINLGYSEDGIDEIGLGSGIAVQADHDQIETVLAEETSLYFRSV